MTGKRRASAGIVILAGLAAATGCTFAVDNGNNGDTSSNINRNTGGGPSDDQLQVQFRNLLNDVDVDTEFYATNDELDDPGSDLFVPAYRIQVGIGAAGTGILLADTDDEIEIPCTSDLVIGTTGGSFKDPDTGATLGQGDQRLLQVGLIFDCGDTVTFTYSSEGDEFTVDIL